jgi:hypothetical protein
MHVRIGGIEEEAEGILDVPVDVGLGSRNCGTDHRQSKRQAQASAGSEPHQASLKLPLER